MNDNKMMAIIAVAMFGFLSVMIIFGDSSMNDTPQSKLEQEKTKQMEIQAKLKQLQVDSMKIANEHH